MRITLRRKHTAQTMPPTPLNALNQLSLRQT
jgi:hypothetical protein